MRFYLQLLLILKYLGFVLTFCVLDKKKGWRLDCGIRDSYLFRLKEYGGIQANFDLGFGIGDEKGFPNSISKTSHKGKGGQHHYPPPPPPYGFQPYPQHHQPYHRFDNQINPNRRNDFPYKYETPQSPALQTQQRKSSSWFQKKIEEKLPKVSQAAPVQLDSNRYHSVRHDWSQPAHIQNPNQQWSRSGYFTETQPTQWSQRPFTAQTANWAQSNKELLAESRTTPVYNSQNVIWHPTQRTQQQQPNQYNWSQSPQGAQWSQQSQRQHVAASAASQNQWSYGANALSRNWNHGSEFQQSSLGVPQSPYQVQRRFAQGHPQASHFQVYNPSANLIPPPPSPPPFPGPVPFQSDSGIHRQDLDSEQQFVFRIPKTTTPRTPTIGPNMGKLLQLPPETSANSDNVPSFAAKKFVVREAPFEFYPPDYDRRLIRRNRPKIHVEIPRTKFYCEEQKFLPGIYADAKLGCKMFHLCVPSAVGSTLTSYLCPNSTLFDQSILQCNYWYNVDCETSVADYDANLALALSYRRINAAHLSLQGATDVNALSLLSQNVNQIETPKEQPSTVGRMGKALSATIHGPLKTVERDSEWKPIVKNSYKAKKSLYSPWTPSKVSNLTNNSVIANDGGEPRNNSRTPVKLHTLANSSPTDTKGEITESDITKIPFMDLELISNLTLAQNVSENQLNDEGADSENGVDNVYKITPVITKYLNNSELSEHSVDIKKLFELIVKIQKSFVLKKKLGSNDGSKIA